MPNIYLNPEIQKQADQFAKTGLIMSVSRSQLVALVLEALFNDPIRVLGDKVRKPDHPFNGTPEQNYQTLRSFAPKADPQPETD